MVRILAVFILFTSSTAIAYIVDGFKINQPKLLEYANKNLLRHGTLQKNSKGLVYVKVPEKFVLTLAHEIEKEGYTKTYANHSQIEVVNSEESKTCKLDNHIGENINFDPLGFYTYVEDDNEYYMLAVDIPSLSSIRIENGLSPTIDDHAFALRIASRKIESEDELADD